jgi:DNA-binding NtrC family response regulator
MDVKPRILVVDDEPVVRESLHAWFTEGDYPVDIAASAAEALQMLQASSWDILVSDIKMPGMDGLELQQEVKKIAPHMTIIFMTAYASMDTAVQAIKEGAYDYVTKPLDPDDLEQIINRAAERQLLLRENLQLRETVQAVGGSTEEIPPEDLKAADAKQAPPAGALSLAEVEKQHIQSVLEQMSGNLAKAAQALQIDQTTLEERLRKYGLEFSQE